MSLRCFSWQRVLRALSGCQFTTTRSLQIFQLFRQFAIIMVSVVLAKSHLSTADIGHFELLNYLGTFSTFFLVHGLLQAISPLYFNFDEQQRKVFIFNVLIVFLGLAALIFLSFLLFKNCIIRGFTGRDNLPDFELFALFLSLNLVSFPVEYLYLIKNRARAIVWWGIASAATQIAAVALPLSAARDLQTCWQALSIVAFAKLCWMVGLVWQWGKPVVHKKLIYKYLNHATPLMAAAFTSSLILLFDQWLVSWYFQDEATFAIYRFGARELPWAQALATALGVAIVPALVQNLPEGLATLKKMSRQLFHWVFPVAILLMCIAQPLFPVVFNPDFRASAELFAGCLLITGSRVLLPNAILISKQKNSWILIISLIELVLKIMLGFWFISRWGLEGVVASAVVAYFFEKIALIFLLETRLNIRTVEWLDLRWYFFYVGMLLMAFFIT